MIQFGPIMMPCRACDVPPGENCRRATYPKGEAPLRPGTFHAKREAHANTASELGR